jgi:3-isopropylmalate/(R)-2-methylmalate dehydratase small subunit
VAARLRITGPVIPFGRANVDTDLILPAQYMKTLTRDGLGEGAFAALRGQTGNPFEDPWYRGAPILVAGGNFGCGSSREHAVWALQQIDIEAVIAPSFGEIFEANALRNGLVAVRVPDDDVEKLLELGPQRHVTIDIIGERVLAPHGEIEFHLDPFRKHCLVNGLDETAVTEGFEAEITAYEERVRHARPWEQHA